MTAIRLHIGLAGCGDARLQAALDAKRARLLKDGVLFPRSPGGSNHTRLFMAVTDPERPEPLRWQRGFADPRQQDRLRQEVIDRLTKEIADETPDVVILSAIQLADLTTREVERLVAILAPLSNDIKAMAIVEGPAQHLASRYEVQIGEGRVQPLSHDLALPEGDWEDIYATHAPNPRDITRGLFASHNIPPLSLDLAGLVARWERVLGEGNLTLLPYAPEAWDKDAGRKPLAKALGLKKAIGALPDKEPAPPRSDETLERMREMNMLLSKAIATRRVVPPQLRKTVMTQIETPGTPIAPGTLHAISDRFAKSHTALKKRFPDLATVLKKPRKTDAWTPPTLTQGFRASQYMAAFMPRIERVTEAAKREALAAEAGRKTELTEAAKAVMSDAAILHFDRLKRSRFAPHDRIGQRITDKPAFEPAPTRKPAPGTSGRIIVGCMKNEAPYIVEWVAYHRAIGFDNFIIYSNNSEDGTGAILDRLAAMGVLEHRKNDNWRGKSPQQHALNQSLKEPLVQRATWIAHIDVDEFINIQTGNGTLDALFEATQGATNIAMTWRLFGHNGVIGISDAPVIEQFTTAAPRFVPKPHTAWGFKTLMKNIGAYQKLSCHRPNKLVEAKRDAVSWVNGSGQPIDDPIKDRGWRSEMRSIGYDLVQLNHYALRSAESFLVKRQRGRALHVDRSIGLNYWIRMDWSDCEDRSIQRNLPRLQTEMNTLLADDELQRLHDDGLAWHRAKAEALKSEPGFAALFDSATSLKLTALERAAYALALDQET